MKVYGRSSAELKMHGLTLAEFRRLIGVRDQGLTEDESEDVLKTMAQQMRAVAAKHQAFLKQLTGDSYTLTPPFITDGPAKVIFKFLGPKGKGAVVAPAFVLALTYNPGRDTYDAQVSYYDSEASLTQGKELLGVEAGDLARPAIFWSWWNPIESRGPYGPALDGRSSGSTKVEATMSWTDKDRKALRDFIWRNTHKDYRGTSPERGRTVLRQAPSGGGTESVQLDKLNDAELVDQLKYKSPKTDKDRELFDRLGLPYKKAESVSGVFEAWKRSKAGRSEARSVVVVKFTIPATKSTQVDPEEWSDYEARMAITFKDAMERAPIRSEKAPKAQVRVTKIGFEGAYSKYALKLTAEITGEGVSSEDEDLMTAFDKRAEAALQAVTNAHKDAAEAAFGDLNWLHTVLDVM